MWSAAAHATAPSNAPATTAMPRPESNGDRLTLVVGGFFGGELFGFEGVVALCLDHAGTPRVLKDAAGIDHGPGVAEGLRRDGLAGVQELQRVGVQVQFDFVAGLHDLTEALGGFDGVKLAGSDAVAEEDARKSFRDDRLTARGAERDRRVFAGTAADRKSTRLNSSHVSESR